MNPNPCCNLLDQVDSFFAVDGGGNCLPGPHVPLGMVRLGPDTVNYNTNGYASGEMICGFSHLHVSGTGGSGRYGNILIVPLRQTPDPRLRSFAKENETASPGYYSVDLLPKEVFGEIKPASARIGCELTSTAHCGVHRYSFGSEITPHIELDLGHCLAGESIGGWVEATAQGTIIGRADYKGGWGHNHPYSIFFCVEFSQAPDCVRTYSIHHRDGGVTSDGPGMRAVAAFAGCRQLVVRVGISYTSVALAQKHLSLECGAKDFDQIRESARNAWIKVLETVQVSGGESAQRELVSTFLYRLYAMPDDLGLEENPWFQNEHRQFNNFYCLWDSVRNANSLFSLIDPGLARDMANALLEIGQRTGWMPDAWIMGHSAFIQGGSSADVILTESACKGFSGIDYPAAIRQMRKNHEAASPNPRFFGRYPQYREMGYLPNPVPNCTSRTLEYATQDECLARLAEFVGDTATAKIAAQRAEAVWQNWSDEYMSMSPRDQKGNWIEFNPWVPSRPDFWDDPNFYEGTGHDWTLTLWYGIPELIRRHGGSEAFCAHLDQYIDSMYMWKEINLHTPWLYHFAGRPDRSREQVQRMMKKHYKAGRSGLSDNEDMGSHSAFYICSAIGLYPIPGTAWYLINAPIFPEVSIRPAGSDKLVRIHAIGVDAGKAYVTSASWNGTPLHSALISHQQLAEGGVLEFTMDSTPGDWGKQVDDLERIFTRPQQA